MVLFRRAREAEKPRDLPSQLVTVLDPASAASEAYRILRTNLLYASVEKPPKVITFTSPGLHEGKSITCANVGVVLAQADKRVLIVDCDFRMPVQHKMFNLRNHWGVVNVVMDERSAQDVWHEPLPGLRVLTVGTIPPNPTEVLSSRRFVELLWHLREKSDYVLVDAPPVEMVADPAILANQSDGVLLVIDAQRTRKASVRRSVRRLESVGGSVLGTVMNRVQAPRGGQQKPFPDEYPYS